MAIGAGVGFLMAELGFFMADEGRLMTSAADMALLAFKQAVIIPGMGRVTGHTTIITIAYQVIMR